MVPMTDQDLTDATVATRSVRRGIVTNIADLSPSMRAHLQRPAEPDLPAEGTNAVTLTAMVQRGLITITAKSPLTYRLTDAGKRCRDALVRQEAPTATVLAVADHGWALLNENDFGGHSITTWTRDEHALVLVWSGAYEVSAAIYDGFPLDLDQLLQTIMLDADGQDVAPEHLLELAGSRAQQVAHPRFANDLTILLGAMARYGVPDNLRVPALALAAAILATPHTR